MKLKHLLAVALMAIGCSAWADTDKLTVENGWQKVTDLSSMTIGDYYFAFVDDSRELMLSFGWSVEQSTENAYRTFVYTNAEAAEMNPNMLWTLEAFDGGYNIKNAEYQSHFLQTEWNAAWYCRTHDNGGGDKSWGKFNITLSEGKYLLENGKYTGQWVGPWANNFVHGAGVAANKPVAQRGYFQIYAIAKTAVDCVGNATAENPANMTYKIVNPDFECGKNNLYGWTNSGTLNFGGQGNKALGGVVGSCYVECYHKNGTLDLNQTLTGMPVGKYKVTAVAQTVDGKLYANASETAVNENGTYEVELNLLAGDLKIGFKAEDNGTKWTAIDNFQVYYYGPVTDLSAFISSLAEEVENAKAIKDEIMNAEVATALQTAINTYEGASYSTKEEYTDAIGKIQNAISAAKVSIAVYAKVATINAIAATLDADGQAAYASTLAAYNDRTLGADGATIAQNALIAAAKAQTTDGADMSAAMINNDFVECTNGNFPGWKISAPNGGNTWKNTDTRVEYWIGTAASGSFKYYQTISGLPNGKYKVSASMYNSSNGVSGDKVDEPGQVGVYATSGLNTVWGLVNVDGTECNTYESDEIDVVDGKIELGVGNKTTMTARWFVVDWVKLQLVKKFTDEEAAASRLQMITDAPVGTELTYLIVNPEIDGNTNGWTCEKKNGGNGPIVDNAKFEYWAGSATSRDEAGFDYYQVINDLPEGKYIVSAQMYNSLNGEGGAEMNASCGVYANDAICKVQVDGIDLRRYGVVATVAADGVLRLGVKSEGRMGARWFVADNFMLVKAGTATADIMDCNYVLKSGEKYLALGQADAESNEASLGADHSTELVLSAKTVDGITTLKNGATYFFVSSGSTSQVYANSENSGNKLNVNWLAIPADGGVALLNIGTGKMLVNNEGKIQAEVANVNSTKLAVFEPEAVASMAVNATAQYGTFVAPFNVAIPAGVTAYTVDGIESNGETLTLTEVATTIPANTPVVLKAESGKDAEKFYGEVVAGTPTEGALTGTYVATPAPANSYVLQLQEGVAGFYKVESVQPTVGANRCYLTASSDARVLTFGEETAIKAIDALTSGKAEIFDLNGRRLNSLQKGINVVNGVKILVK